MCDCIIYAAGYSPAFSYCTQALKESGYTIISEPSMEATHLLLPVPSFTQDGSIIGGGNLHTLLTLLPEDIIVIGGNLDCPELNDYVSIDLLNDPTYLALNAQITAHCAVKLALNQLPVTLNTCDVLIIGWGRVGKYLAQLLHQMGANVTVCARNKNDRSLLCALGYQTATFKTVDLSKFRVIFNTVPVMLFPSCPGNALKIDLASRLGMGSRDVIWARGLPGKDAPESSGELIYETVTEILGKE